MPILQQDCYLTERELADLGFKSLGRNIRVSSDARIYGAERISIGNNVRIDGFAMLVAGAGDGYITLGDYVYISHGCHLSGTFGIEMQDFTGLAANCVIYSASDDYSGDYMTAQAIPKEFTRLHGGKVTFARHSLCGSSCTVIGKAYIGEGCSIGSMSLVYKDLEPWGIYAGIPVKRLRERSRKLLELERKLLGGAAAAPEPPPPGVTGS